MKKIFLCSILFLSLCSSVLCAQERHWEFSGWYGGGSYPNVVFDPKNKNRVYLTSDVTGIWRSDDNGEEWHFMNKGLGYLRVPQVAIAPSDSKVLYATTNGGVFYSHNSGDSWQASETLDKKIIFERPANYRSLVIHPRDPKRVCVGTALEEIFCSSNYGNAWQKIPNPDFITPRKKPLPIPVLTFGKNAAFLIVAFSDRVAKYDFKRRRWQDLGQFKSVTDLIWDIPTNMLFVASEHRVWFKKFSARSWKASAVIHQGQAFRIAKFEKTLYAVWRNNWTSGVVVSDNLGQTWKEQKQDLQADAALNPTRSWAQKDTLGTALKVSPFDPKVIFRCDAWGVWRSDDGGITWKEKIKGAPNSVVSELTITRQGEIFVATMDNGLLKSSDQGKTYQPLFPLDKYDENKNGHIWRVIARGEHVLATSSPWDNKINQVLLSRDGGKTFMLVREGLPLERPKVNTMWGEGYPRAIAIDPSDPQTFYLGMDGDDGGGLFISRDGGQTWNRSVGQPESVRIYHGLAIDPRDPGTIVWGASGKNGGVYISSDHGETFRHVFKEMQWVFNVAISSQGKIYAAGDSSGPALYAADSADKPFRLVKKFTGGAGRAVDAIAIHPFDPNMIVIGTVDWNKGSPCHIHLSRDGGKNWEEINGDLPDGAGASSIVFDPSGKYLYIGRYAGSVYRTVI